MAVVTNQWPASVKYDSCRTDNGLPTQRRSCREFAADRGLSDKPFTPWLIIPCVIYIVTGYTAQALLGFLHFHWQSLLLKQCVVVSYGTCYQKLNWSVATDNLVPIFFLLNSSQDTAIYSDPRQIEFIFVCYNIKIIPSDARVSLGPCPTSYSLDSNGSPLLSKVNKVSKVCC